ncbi:hypothetical protein NDU88_002479 [Pleurodeles waltl]|uniref:Uncharacterized protein n=1 Tax=Pleurodeles waltl TaxID=8319 RepID=A0AAV7TN78_PLEWA|nr:hypothetical protein NDU88_002479 [Pleurodeles waltl]
MRTSSVTPKIQDAGRIGKPALLKLKRQSSPTRRRVPRRKSVHHSLKRSIVPRRRSVLRYLERSTRVQAPGCLDACPRERKKTAKYWTELHMVTPGTRGLPGGTCGERVKRHRAPGRHMRGKSEKAQCFLLPPPPSRFPFRGTHLKRPCFSSSVAGVSAGRLPRCWFEDPRCQEGFLSGLQSYVQHCLPGLLLFPRRVSSSLDATRPCPFLPNRLSYEAGAWRESSYSVHCDQDVDGDWLKDTALPGWKWQQKPGRRTLTGPLVAVAARHKDIQI